MRSLSVRPFFTAVWLALALGALVFFPSFSIAQEPPEGTRKIVNKVVPAYPELAGKLQIVGSVKVEVLVLPNGKVKSTQVVGGHPVLVKAAVDAIEQWKWGPAPQETKESVELRFHP